MVWLPRPPDFRQRPGSLKQRPGRLFLLPVGPPASELACQVQSQVKKCLPQTCKPVSLPVFKLSQPSTGKERHPPIRRQRPRFSFPSPTSALRSVFLSVPAVCVCFLTPNESISSTADSIACVQELICCYLLSSRFVLLFNWLTNRENELLKIPGWGHFS